MEGQWSSSEQGAPSSSGLESTFPSRNSGHYNKGPVPQVPFQIHASEETKDIYLHFLGFPLNTGYSQTCLLPGLFSRSPK